MAQQVFKIKYSKNESVISASELLKWHFHGISLCDRSGREIPISSIEKHIAFAQKQIENLLHLKFIPQIIEERRDFMRNNYNQWGYLKVSYPITGSRALLGYLNNVQQITFPESWTSIVTSSEDELFSRNLNIVPSGSSNIEVDGAVVYYGITPHLNFGGNQNIPNYWNVKYITGFKKIPEDIVSAISKIAAMKVFAVLGDIVLGAGIASQNLNFDGFSQGITTTQSAENSAYSARIRQYAGELKTELSELKGFYRGITFDVL